MPSEIIVTAALLVIGDEILSGRTRDANLPFLAGRLNEHGIRLREARVVPDDEAEIVAAVDALRRRYDYVFTSGGIGPTHDDITAASIAKAFGRPLVRHPEAVRRLEAYYPPGQLNAARLRMTEMPEGADPIDNPISAAPGFRIENVFVLAGVPVILQAMVDGLAPGLAGGTPVRSRTITCALAEGTLAEGLTAIQQRHAAVAIGSYPYFRAGMIATSLVLRGTDPVALAAAAEEVGALIRSLGGEPADLPGT